MSLCIWGTWNILTVSMCVFVKLTSNSAWYIQRRKRVDVKETSGNMQERQLIKLHLNAHQWRGHSSTLSRKSFSRWQRPHGMGHPGKIRRIQLTMGTMSTATEPQAWVQIPFMRHKRNDWSRAFLDGSNELSFVGMRLTQPLVSMSQTKREWCNSNPRTCYCCGSDKYPQKVHPLKAWCPAWHYWEMTEPLSKEAL